tara:strand:+ start:225 stop:845 length:621 start_codon:yes stop_codon:yes gene_type:complete
MNIDKNQEMSILYKTVHNCTDCLLHQTRLCTVPGSGNINAEIMMIGEGPGFEENRQGKPFVGPAGAYLDELLLSIGLTKADIFLTNMLKCRTPKNRDPFANELFSCNKYLNRQVEIINPSLIITLGKYSTQKFLLGRPITSVRGKLFRVNERYIFPMFHPAAGLHDSSKREVIYQDFGRIAEILKARKKQIEVSEVDIFNVQSKLF